MMDTKISIVYLFYEYRRNLSVYRRTGSTFYLTSSMSFFLFRIYAVYYYWKFKSMIPFVIFHFVKLFIIEFTFFVARF